MADSSTFTAMAPVSLAGLLSSAGSPPGTPRDWQPPDPTSLTGLAPHLVVDALIGVGGMAAVYRAHQEHLDRPVALKILNPRLAADAAGAERFRREARLLAQLDHPHVVRLHDAGAGGGWQWLLLELVEGATLRQTLALGKPSPAEALRLLSEVTEGVAHAHAQGIIHRDLKPENILLDDHGVPRVADFGLAKLMGDEARQALTQRSQVLGTAAYMAPEQFTAPTSVNQRADVYALGVLAYELLTGHLPLGRFEPPSASGADPRLDQLVLRALERDPARRLPDAGAFAEALRALAPAPSLPVDASPPPLVTLVSPLRPLLPVLGAAVGGGVVVLLAHDQVGFTGKILLLLFGLFLLTPLMSPREPEEPAQESWRRLRCRPEDGQFLGVAAGLARCSTAPAWAWRLLFTLACVWFGAGAVIYGALWLALRRRDEG